MSPTNLDFLTEFLIAILAGSGSAYAVLRYLGKTLVQYQIDKSLKTFDAQLARRSDALKTELSIYAHEQNVALSRVDAQRAKAIQDVYAALRAWAKPASVIAVGSPLMNVEAEAQLGFYSVQAEQAHHLGMSLADTLADNAIYFDMELYATLVELSSKCLSSIATFLLPLRQGAADGTPANRLLHNIGDHRIAFANTYHDEILPAIRDITDQFRNSLGFMRGAEV